MKRIISLVISVVMVATLTGCISLPTTETVTIETDTPGGTAIPIPDDMQYFDTIEEAVVHNELEIVNTNIDEIIKLFETDEFAVLFFRKNVNGSDVVNAFRFAAKEIDGTRSYAAIAATGMSWETHKLTVKRGKVDEIGEVRYCIASDILRYFRIDDTKNFFWGLSQTERVRSLRIEGQLVTEVIEVELDGETAFFWYFKDVKTDKRPVFKDLREYTEGEFIITMDE